MEKKRTALQAHIFADHAAALADPGYPGFHLASPAHPLFDYWGAFYRDGYYHIFYDICIDPADSEHSVYGHSRSRDLIHWEFLPLPIAPLDSELRMNDGFICQNGKGEAIMLYTSVPESASAARTHVAAVGTNDLLYFKRIPEGSPFMTLQNHGGPAFTGGWSDPWIFEFQGRTLMLMSKCFCPSDNTDPLPIYEAMDDTMLHWAYRGNLFKHNGEVVNFFPLGDKWVLIYSPYSAIEYFIGTLDPDTLCFTPEHHDILSYGYHSQHTPTDRGFYATCIYPIGDRCILCGWISGFVGVRGWDGCMGIPRELKINTKLQLTQQPIAQTDSLHEKKLLEAYECRTVHTHFPLGSNMLDLQLDCSFDAALTLTVSDAGTAALTIDLAKDHFAVNGERYPTAPFGGSKNGSLRLLIDRSFAEIFLGDGAVSATRCFAPIGTDTALILSSDQPIYIHSLAVWQMKPTSISYHHSLIQYKPTINLPIS